jgi:hypothetical protein
VEGSVNDNNLHKAIEIILAIDSRDPAASKSISPSRPDRKYWGVFIVYYMDKQNQVGSGKPKISRIFLFLVISAGVPPLRGRFLRA